MEILKQIYVISAIIVAIRIAREHIKYKSKVSASLFELLICGFIPVLSTIAAGAIIADYIFEGDA